MSAMVRPLARSRSTSRSKRVTSSRVRRFFISPSLAQSTEGLPFRLDQISGSRPSLVGILDSPEEVAVRRQPLERIEAKLLHLIRAVRKAKISGASPGVRRALARHAEELAELFSRSLGRPK